MNKKAAGVLLRINDKFVAIRRRKDDAVGIPCGKLEEGESFYRAAKREFFEETGVEVEVLPVPIYVSHMNETEVWIFMGELDLENFDTNVSRSEGEIFLADESELASDLKFGKFNKEVLRSFHYKVDM